MERQLIRLTPYVKEKITNLHTSGPNNVEIVNKMLHEENLKISRQTISFTINKFKQIGTLERTRTVTGTKKINDDHVSFIDMCLRENNELTCSELAWKIKEVFSVNVSAQQSAKKERNLAGKAAIPSIARL